MPFTIGPFELLVFLVVIIVLAVVVARRQAAASAAPSPIEGGPSLDDLINLGWRVESETADYLFLVKGQRVNHLLHFIVGLLTLGAWWIVWLVLVVAGGERRMTLSKP